MRAMHALIVPTIVTMACVIVRASTAQMEVNSTCVHVLVNVHIQHLPANIVKMVFIYMLKYSI